MFTELEVCLLSLQAMLAEIRNITQAPIRYLFLSHNHYDHIKGAQVFRDEGKYKKIITNL